VIRRYPDRTFEERTTIAEDRGNPSEEVNSSGTWSVTGYVYTLDFREIDNPDYNDWKATIVYVILGNISADKFTYTGTTTPALTETRISPNPY